MTRHGDRTLPGQPLGRGPPRRSLPVGLARTGLPTPKAWAAAASSRGPGRGSTVKVTLRVLAGPPRSRCAESSKSPLPRAESRVVTGARAAAGAGPGDRGRHGPVHTWVKFLSVTFLLVPGPGFATRIPRGGLPRNCHGWPRTKFRSRMQGAQCRFKMHRFAQSILR